jgi:hypothetical protein
MACGLLLLYRKKETIGLKRAKFVKQKLGNI